MYLNDKKQWSGEDIQRCKHLDHQTVSWELRHGFRDNAFMKNSNGTLGGGDLD
jgi:hypothetical protein